LNIGGRLKSINSIIVDRGAVEHFYGTPVKEAEQSFYFLFFISHQAEEKCQELCHVSAAVM
jgi:hypothetical protein